MKCFRKKEKQYIGRNYALSEKLKNLQHKNETHLQTLEKEKIAYMN